MAVCGGLLSTVPTLVPHPASSPCKNHLSWPPFLPATSFRFEATRAGAKARVYIADFVQLFSQTLREVAAQVGGVHAQRGSDQTLREVAAQVGGCMLSGGAI